MIHTRPANEYDAQVIADFQIKMARETEGLELDRDTVNNGIISVFRDPQKGKYYVAAENDKIVASMLITHEWSDWRNNWVYWLQSVYVIPEKRGIGVFKLMYQHILKQVNDSNEVAGIRLYVDKKNLAAREVYNKLGMDGDHYQVFEWMK
ncbi:MAG: GNAT family N-acetyltransferase [Bacteroidetes bacterium]|nr:GNAT family N-acetyltransferase [Bacteroidota bacterium]MBL6943812.1 GNAT family N-acetyltransferase [Bacteroidales bacterium]